MNRCCCGGLSVCHPQGWFGTGWSFARAHPPLLQNKTDGLGPLGSVCRAPPYLAQVLFLRVMRRAWGKWSGGCCGCSCYGWCAFKARLVFPACAVLLSAMRSLTRTVQVVELCGIRVDVVGSAPGSRPNHAVDPMVFMVPADLVWNASSLQLLVENRCSLLIPKASVSVSTSLFTWHIAKGAWSYGQKGQLPHQHGELINQKLANFAIMWTKNDISKRVFNDTKLIDNFPTYKNEIYIYIYIYEKTSYIFLENYR